MSSKIMSLFVIGFEYDNYNKPFLEIVSFLYFKWINSLNSESMIKRVPSIITCEMKLLSKVIGFF